MTALHGRPLALFDIYRYEISIVDISKLLKNIDINIDIDKDNLENIDIDKTILENIDIGIDIDKDNLGNIVIDIDIINIIDIILKGLS